MATLEIDVDHKFSTSLLRVMPKSKVINLSGDKAKKTFLDSNIDEIGFSINKYNPDFNCIGYGFVYEKIHSTGNCIFEIEWNNLNSGFDVILKGTFKQELPDAFFDEFKEDGDKASLFLTGLVYREGVVRGFVSELIDYNSDETSTAIQITNYRFV